MIYKKILLFIIILVTCFFATGCSTSGRDENTGNVEVIFCPGISYRQGSGAEKMIYASINRNNAGGSIYDPNGSVIAGSTMRPSNSASAYSITDVRAFLTNEAAINGEYKLVYTVENKEQTPATINITWPTTLPDFPSVSDYIVTDGAGVYKNLQVDIPSSVRNMPECDSIQYRIKIYQFQSGGQIYDMSKQTTSMSVNMTILGGSGWYPVLEAIAYKNEKPVFVCHYVFNKPIGS